MPDQATPSNPTTTEFPRFYVYALIDPTNNNTPFYIGKGTVLRSLAHAAKVTTTENLDSLVGLEEKNEGQSTPKIQKIKELLAKGYSVNDFVRVICRELTEPHALAVEAMLIQSAYSNLTNVVSGHHAERFRPFGNWKFIHSLDEKRTLYYVYALINPATNVPFYIGKGTNHRAEQHFEDAKKGKASTEKLDEIRSLIAKGHKVQEMVRIVAHTGNDEALAYFLESVWMKFMMGYTQVANSANAHKGNLIRAHGDWKRRKGFDIETSDQRQILADVFKGLGADALLKKVTDKLIDNDSVNQHFVHFDEGTQFKDFKIMGAGELVAEKVIKNHNNDQVTLCIFTRTTGSIQVALVGRLVNQKNGLSNQFLNLNSLPIGRKDFIHIPEVWKYKKGITYSVEVAVKRAQLLIELFNLQSKNDASAELKHVITEQEKFTPKNKKSKN